MISDAERREAARKLRTELWHMKRKKEWYEKNRDFEKCGNRAYRNIAGSVAKSGNSIAGNYINIVERLADLIDRPTCSMEYRPEWSGDEIYPTRAYECSVCGHIVQDGKPDYCPGCGAEVVE